MKSFVLFLTVLVHVFADEGGSGIRENISIYDKNINPGDAFENDRKGNDLEIHRRIIGGRIARTNEFPYQVAIRFRDATLSTCGGSIVDNNWVLTAAHCCNHMTASKLEVVPGSHTDLSKLTTRPYKLNVTKIWVHPDYNTKTKVNDIAMLKVDGSLIQNKYGIFSEKIEMAKGPETFVGKTATVSGYGLFEFSAGRGSMALRTVDMQILSNDKCRIYNVAIDDKSMLCAGIPQTAQNSCQGDSGGPLVVKRQNAKPLLVGVVSFGGGCKRPKLPSVYMRVSYYEPLVKQVMKEN